MDPENNELLDEEMQGFRAASFQKTIRAARGRRRRRQRTVWGIPFLLLFGMVAFQNWNMSQVRVTRNVVIHPTTVTPVMGAVSTSTEKTEAKFKIPTLTDDEFNELMKGYPLAIIRKNGETHYVPLNGEEELTR